MHTAAQINPEQIFKIPAGTSSHDYLQSVSSNYPYFSPGQFFLLKEMTAGTEAYKKQAAKTALFFNNPHWLQFQLQPRKPIQPIPVAPVLEDSFDADNTDNNDDESLMEKEIEPMKMELRLSDRISNSEEGLPLFEPMHLVDYFASQGIKLSEEVQTADKLGKQLKSFTEWLKTMKKIPSAAGGQEAENAGHGVSAIQSLAEKSNKEDDVLTESMAEVFAKQGKKDKAIDVYQKLSLLDPSKIAYFAAKIEQLKGE